MASLQLMPLARMPIPSAALHALVATIPPARVSSETGRENPDAGSMGLGSFAQIRSSHQRPTAGWAGLGSFARNWRRLMGAFRPISYVSGQTTGFVCSISHPEARSSLAPCRRWSGRWVRLLCFLCRPSDSLVGRGQAGGFVCSISDAVSRRSPLVP